jgi:hypothetical protein
MKREPRIVMIVLAVWFVIAFGFGLTDRFEQASARAVAITVWTLTIFLLLGWWLIPPINCWANTVDPGWLIALHLIRFVGFYFLFLCRREELTCGFARPAGIGDAITAVGAAVLLFWPLLRGRKPSKPWIDIWNVFGFIDIILVVFTAYRIGLADRAGMAPLRSFPLMLLPTFFVPLIIASHILIFVRLRRLS